LEAFNIWLTLNEQNFITVYKIIAVRNRSMIWLVLK